MGRLPLIALEAVLRSYVTQDYGAVPLLACIRAPQQQVRARVQGWRGRLSEQGIEAEAIDSEAMIGGGAYADRSIEAVALRLTRGGPERFSQELRRGRIPLLGRVKDGAVLLDGRSVLAGEDELLVEMVAQGWKRV
jgi:L-seryl-tRNA(Ser) seleniumtransferase